MLDPQDELYDKRLARHLVSLYYCAAEENEKEFMVSFFQTAHNLFFHLLISTISGARLTARLYCLRKGAH